MHDEYRVDGTDPESVECGPDLLAIRSNTAGTNPRKARAGEESVCEDGRGAVGEQHRRHPEETHSELAIGERCRQSVISSDTTGVGNTAPGETPSDLDHRPDDEPTTQTHGPDELDSETTDDTASAATRDEPTKKSNDGPHRGRRNRTLSVSMSALGWAITVVAVTAVAIAFAALYFSARADISAEQRRAADTSHAERIAADYATGAATIQYSDMGGWLNRLKANTTPQLANKFDATAPKLDEILAPLKWSSTASPIAAKVISESNGIYKVNVFLTVNSTNSQSPDGGQTTVTYSITLDRNNDWKITDVGGIDGALPGP
ncbi:hypothetical protein [Gordonia alkanivorans]|uniref:hypothetical protein n=1 Tax=Gordonia alkanivorans TaxID=84096 RepID=UPI001E45C74C|nr:hypothetical protein [Gordonia alkanivorans]